MATEFTGSPVPLALTGATAATRYVGGTASGAPTTGTFAVGDFVIDQAGALRVCTVAGSPGTWKVIGAGNAFGITSRTVILQGTVAYTVPAGTLAILVECVGAGGGGGGTTTAAVSAATAGGGGGGAYSQLFLANPKLTAFTVAVGASGAGGAADGSGGATGGDTSFDTGPSIVLAKGGVGGQGEAAGTTLAIIPGGQGGAAAAGIGTILSDGGAGGYGLRLSGLLGTGGAGGAGVGGIGGGGAFGSFQGIGYNGQGYGAGGSGGSVQNGSAAAAGGNGPNGLVGVWEFA